MKMTNQQYSNYVDKKSPNSSLWKNMLWAFLIGGTICTVGQVVFNIYVSLGLKIENAESFTPITMVFLGALLTGLKVYDNIAKIGGAGTLVPITGFANAVVSPAMEFKSEGYIMGMSAKMFTIAGPVIVFGVIASVIYGILYCLII